jgi:hypothetical protein
VVKEFTDDDDALLAELGVEVEVEANSSRTALEERIIAGFEEIQRFFDEHGRAPQHGEDREIFERLYAVRLDRINMLADARSIVEPLDHQKLLQVGTLATPVTDDDLDDDALLAELGVEPEALSLTELRHVRSAAEKKSAEEIANRERCEDFDTFKPLFDRVQKELQVGMRVTRQIRKDAGFLKAEVRAGDFFIVGGQLSYVASIGDAMKAPNGEFDARLRVVFSNGTESNMLLRSLQRALYKDEASRMVSDPSAAGPLFETDVEEDDQASGTIYVLRSMSALPIVTENRNVLHKIGVTSGKVERRITNAKLDPTFLMADVKIVATYELFNINRSKLENLIHRIFGPARLDIEIKDRFGIPIIPREWFLVPVFAIDEAVEKIRDGTIKDYFYDPKQARLIERGLG